jgi:hypothetical protein
MVKKPKDSNPTGIIITEAPWAKLGVDLVGPLPETSRGNKHILVCTDHFTKFTEAYPLKDKTSDAIAEVLVTQIFCRYGAPNQLLTDQAPDFTNEILMKIYDYLNITKQRTSAYHPQGNGQTERFNRTMLAMLRSYVDDYKTEWDRMLPFICHAYNISENKTTNYIPHYLMFGRNPRTTITIMYSDILSNLNGMSEKEGIQLYENHLLENYHNTIQKAYENQVKSKIKTTTALNKNKTLTIYKPGDLVWLYMPEIPEGQHRKFYSPWSGPFRIKNMPKPILAKIETLEGLIFDSLIHINRLKHYVYNKNKPNHEIKLHGATPITVINDAARKAPIGRRVIVLYNPKKEEWVPGTVLKYDKKSKKHEILFDDYAEDTILIKLVGANHDNWRYIEQSEYEYTPSKQCRTGKWKNVWPLKYDLGMNEERKNQRSKISEIEETKSNYLNSKNPTKSTTPRKKSHIQKKRQVTSTSKILKLQNFPLIYDPILKGRNVINHEVI